MVTNKENISFLDFYSKIEQNKAFFIDASQFCHAWHDGWICYIDLLGFSVACQKSKDATVNSLVKFHRVIDACLQNSNAKFFQFTDCCFIINDSLPEIINLAIKIMKYSCAINEYEFRHKHNVLGHFLLRPRITIAYGSYLVAEHLLDEQLTTSLNKNTFLAGDGIVKAYLLEKKSFGYGITIALPESSWPQMQIDGRGGNSKPGLQRWRNKNRNAQFCHLPWPLIKYVKAGSNKFYLSPTSNDELTATMANIIDSQEVMSSDFYNNGRDLTVGKHSSALMKFILDLHRYIIGTKAIPRKWAQQLKEFYPRDN